MWVKPASFQVGRQLLLRVSVSLCSSKERTHNVSPALEQIHAVGADIVSSSNSPRQTQYTSSSSSRNTWPSMARSFSGVFTSKMNIPPGFSAFQTRRMASLQSPDS